MKKFATILCAMSLVGSVAFAADSSKSASQKKWPEPTKEQRSKMADLHENFASCLKSDKPMSECRQEMMKSCEDTMGKDCHMMGPHHGMMHHHDMNGSEKNEKSEKAEKSNTKE